MNGSSKCLWPAFFSSQPPAAFSSGHIKAGRGGGHSLLIIQNLRFFSMQFNKMRGNKKMGVGEMGGEGPPPPSVFLPGGAVSPLLLPGRLLS